MVRRHVARGAALWLCLTSTWVLAEVLPRNAELDRGAALVERGDFEDAVATLERGLRQPDVSESQLAELYRLLGLAQLYLGDEERAREAFERLLQVRPDYDVPKGTPPKVKALYARIREDIRKRRLRPVALVVDPVVSVAASQPWPVRARIDNLPLGAKAKVFYRRGGAQTFSSVDFVHSPDREWTYTAVVPALEATAGARDEWEYYVEVFDAAQRRLAGKGDAVEPLRAGVANVKGSDLEAAPPWYQSPWPWVGIIAGVGAIAAVVTVVALQKPTATLDVTVRVQTP